MILWLTTLHENARSALECGSSSYRLRFMRHISKAVAAATALQGTFGAGIFTAAKDPHLRSLPEGGGTGQVFCREAPGTLCRQYGIPVNQCECEGRYVSCEAGRDRTKAGREFHSRRRGVWKRDIMPM